MARMTNAQREEERRIREEVLQQTLASEYPMRFLSTIKNALHENIGLSDVDVETKILEFFDNDTSIRYIVDTVYDPLTVHMIEDLEYTINRKRLKRELFEAEQKAREVALAKLTKEERTLLGL